MGKIVIDGEKLAQFIEGERQDIARMCACSGSAVIGIVGKHVIEVTISTMQEYCDENDCEPSEVSVVSWAEGILTVI